METLTQPRYLRTDAVAAMTGISKATLETWRNRGGGPIFSKRGSVVLYDIRDVEAWIAEGRRTSTSDPGPAR